MDQKILVVRARQYLTATATAVAVAKDLSSSCSLGGGQKSLSRKFPYYFLTILQNYTLLPKSLTDYNGNLLISSFGPYNITHYNMKILSSYYSNLTILHITTTKIYQNSKKFHLTILHLTQ